MGLHAQLWETQLQARHTAASTAACMLLAAPATQNFPTPRAQHQQTSPLPGRLRRRTLLLAACYRNSPDHTRLALRLIAAGCPVDVQAGAELPMTRSMETHSWVVLDALLKAGATPTPAGAGWATVRRRCCCESGMLCPAVLHRRRHSESTKGCRCMVGGARPLSSLNCLGLTAPFLLQALARRFRGLRIYHSAAPMPQPTQTGRAW